MIGETNLSLTQMILAVITRYYAASPQLGNNCMMYHTQFLLITIRNSYFIMSLLHHAAVLARTMDTLHSM